jgi:hypothetical protein
MAREQVTIKIDTDANTGGIDKVERKLLALAAKAKLVNAQLQNAGIKTGKFGDALNDLDDSAVKAGKSTQKLGKDADGAGNGFKKAGKAGKGLAGILKTTYKFAMIGAAIETAGLALALSSVNGLLAIGRFAAKSYQVALSALAKGAAVAAIALATVAAAQRQFVAAQATGRYGGDYKASSAALRGMTGDARLAEVGMKGLTQAFAAASKNSKVTGATSGALAGLLDFAYASGDVEKGASALANIISLIQKGEELSSSKVAGAAKEIGPEFEKTYKEMIAGGKMTSGELIKMFSSGEFAKKAGISGASDAVQGSLLGQFKSFITQMQVMFGDLGAQFIQPVQVAFEEIRRIMVRTFTAISPLLAEYAKGGLLDKFVNGIDVISQFLVKFMREYVPRQEGFFKSFASFWEKVKSAFGSFTAYLQRFSAASKIINKFLGGIIKALGSGLKKNFEAFGESIVKNESSFLKFGDSIEKLISKIFELFSAIRIAFMEALPTLTIFANIISTIVGGVSSMIKGLSGRGFGGSLGLLAAVAPMFLLGDGKRAKGARGFIGKHAKNMLTSKLGIGIGAGIGANYALGKMGAPEMVRDTVTGTIIGGAAGLQLAGMLPKGATKMGAGTMAGIGAIGVGGTILTQSAASEASDFAYTHTGGNRYLATATGATTGALGGAAVGAALTSFGGPTALVGAAIGAVAGALIGGVTGFMKEGKYKKQAKKAARSFVEDYSGIISTALSENNLATARKAFDEFGKNAQKMADLQIKSGTALKEANKQFDVQKDSLEGGIKLMEARFGDLAKASGLTNEQITKLANSAEISLGNGLLSLQDVLAATGIATMRFGDDLKNYLTDAYSEAVSNIRKTLDILNAPKVANEVSRSFREKAIAGTVEQEDRAALLEALAQEQLIASGGDPLKAFQTLYNNIGFKGAKQFDPTNIGLKDGKPILGVLTDTFGTSFSDTLFGGAVDQNGVSEGQKLVDAFFGASGMGGATSGAAAENLVSGLAGIGYEGGSVEEITKMLNNVLTTQGMDPYMKLITSLTSGQFLTPEFTSTPMGPSFGTDVETQLANTLGTDFAKNLQIQKTNEELLRASIDDLSLGMVKWVDSGDTFTTAVGKFDTAAQMIIDELSGDTASPRRNMLNTMGKHSAFDAQIAGNRTVTSGFRTNALGSMSSDHAAGRAYDLVGQNLGLYGQAINKAGGFAEFHGNGSARHLHVVPGNGPVGDTATPYMGAPIMAPSSSSNSTVNLVINATPNMDVNALASEVMYQIERAQRSRNERY